MTKWIFGIAGGSASGKTTFTQMLQERLGSAQCAILLQDSYYKDQSAQFDKDGGQVNFDHPEALDFELMAEHLNLLKKGQRIPVPVYDFKTHTRLDEADWMDSYPVVLIDGILILQQEKIRQLLDSSAFIETSEEVRFQRRLERDVNERGRTPEGVRAQFMAHVKPMHDQFVEPSRKFADKVYSGENHFKDSLEDYLASLATLMQS